MFVALLSLLLTAKAGNAVLAAAPALHPRIAPIAGAVAAGVPELVGLRDLGRAPETFPVTLAVTLPYRHDAELDQLIAMQSDPRSPYFRRYLSNEQFANYFSPTPEDEARVERTLQAAGFRIGTTYTNRTVIDVEAPAGVAERYFQTEIHRVAQVEHGVRYANVRAAILPPELRGLVSNVTGLTNVIYLHTNHQLASPQRRATGRLHQLALDAIDPPGPLQGTRIPGFVPPRPVPLPRSETQQSAPAPQTATPTPAPVVNGVVDPGFESDAFGSWQPCLSLNSHDPEFTPSRVHSGKYAGYARSEPTSSGTGTHFAGICESVTIPANGILTFWVYQTSTEPNTTGGYQEADLIDEAGNRVYNMYQTVNDDKTWTEKSYNLAKYQGGRYFLYFGTGVATGDNRLTEQFVDDVTLSGSPYPTVSTAIGGPFFGPDDGYGPSVTAIGYDMPVQHGYDGAGRSTAVEISGDYSDADLYAYLGYFGITRGGSTTRVEVDGGAPVGTTMDSGSSEATLDVETIVSLAPSTHLYMYLMPDLSSQHVEDVYNRTVSDNLVEVANSSFDGCETGDVTATKAYETIVRQAVAKGITFEASSGDDGSSFCGGKIGVGAPSADPEFVAVGGTSLYVNNDESYKAEDAWSGGGGGVSTIWPIPSYQSGLAGVTGTGRNSPDISFAADPNTGTAFYFAGAWQGPLGGTSWACPIYTAEQTEINQRDHQRNGYVNSRIYAAYKTYGLHAFHDVTSGNNGAYSAHTGYDDATGLGSLNGNLFIPEE
jgi:subtilase family serine protease